jgi:magnesium chelatase subunit D
VSRVFPFSAVVGQERLKLALVLCAIDPSIGGVLVRGPRGVAKTTLARGFAQLLTGAFVELPLGATEERVTGTLDLEQALGERRVAFAPGLLARAHDGALYVDEVNLLPDALVDLLLDAAASGVNVVERDGVSRSHPARFVLIGTMNPEEGELRPQLCDRFGLCVSAEQALAPEERARIVLTRLEFERDPAAFEARFAPEQRALSERCRQARELAPSLELAGPALARVSELCHGAGVDGVRADLAMLRAARAHAAWHGRERIEPADVDAVAELALSHRRRRAPEPPAAPTPSRPPPASNPPAHSPRDGSATSGSPAAGMADRGALRSRQVPPVTGVVLPAWQDLAPWRTRASARRGEQGEGGIDWFRTLLASARPSRSDLYFRPRRRGPDRLCIVAVDCSASMAHSGALALAKGVAQALAAQAEQARVHVALISFGGEAARIELVARARHPGIASVIAGLGAGGGTPLRRALCEALALARRPAHTAARAERRLLLLTDGRTREVVTDLAPHCFALAPLVIDCERGVVRLGRARGLAEALGAGYAHVDSFARAPLPHPR